LVSVPLVLVAVQEIVCDPTANVSPLTTAVDPSRQPIVGTGSPVAVTEKVTARPAPGADSLTVMSDGTVITGTVLTVSVKLPVSVPAPLVAVQEMVCGPAANVSPLATAVAPPDS